MLILGNRVWPAILVGAFFVNYTTAGPLVTSLGIAVGNTLEGGARRLPGKTFCRRPPHADAGGEPVPVHRLRRALQHRGVRDLRSADPHLERVGAME